MKDEEMANEYANNIDYTKTVKMFDCVPYHENCDVADMVAQAFLAGLKAGRLQWHDLRKDPNDLPIGEVSYWFDENPNLKDRKVYGRSIGYYNSCEKEWHGYYKGCPCRVHNVIAWCEIPTFDKE